MLDGFKEAGQRRSGRLIPCRCRRTAGSTTTDVVFDTNLAALGQGLAKMEAPHPTVGARERERVRFEIEDAVNFLGEVLLHAGGQGRLGKTVNLEQRSTKGREAFLQPRHAVVEQAKDVAGQQIACWHVLLRLNLYKAVFGSLTRPLFGCTSTTSKEL